MLHRILWLGLALAGLIQTGTAAIPTAKPNVLFILAEDISKQLACYGEQLVRTPHLDRLAARGVRYTNAFTTEPVCSASRSAIMTGMYQTTIGAHNHRTWQWNKRPLPEGVRTLTDCLRDAGYFTANLAPGPGKAKKAAVTGVPGITGASGTGKTDLNFLTDGPPFDGFDWNQRKPGQPFFAQITINESHKGPGWTYARSKDSPVGHVDAAGPELHRSARPQAGCLRLLLLPAERPEARPGDGDRRPPRPALQAGLSPFQDGANWQDRDRRVFFRHDAPPPPSGSPAMQLTYLGHSCFLVETGHARILIDPFLTGNPAAAMKAEDVRCDAILVSHGHEDHTGDAVAIAKRNDALIVANYELAEYFAAKGARTHGLNPGGAHVFPFGKVKLTLAHHSSSVEAGLNAVYLGSPCGIMLQAGGKTLYHAGDTALFLDMQLIGRANLDAALVPIGDNYTMGPEDALTALDFLKPRIAVPMHYNTWPLIAQDGPAFARKANEAGHTVLPLKPGEKLEI